MKQVTALIDGDIVAYRCAASIWDYANPNAKRAPTRIAYARIQDMVDGILGSLDTDKYRMYLSAHRSFRSDIYPDYKTNRVGLPRPPDLDDCKSYLVNKLHAEVCENIEADDALGIDQCKSQDNTVICSIDKDLHQIPGSHFNFVKGSSKIVTPMGGLRHFYKQLLIGDVADNVKGIRGIGQVKADRLIDPLDSHEEMFDCVRAVYADDVRLLMNCDVLWIQQDHHELFTTRYLKMLKGFKLVHASKICKEQREKATELGKG